MAFLFVVCNALGKKKRSSFPTWTRKKEPLCDDTMSFFSPTGAISVAGCWAASMALHGQSSTPIKCTELFLVVTLLLSYHRFYRCQLPISRGFSQVLTSD